MSRISRPLTLGCLAAACVLVACRGEVSSVVAEAVKDDDHDYYGPANSDDDLETPTSTLVAVVADAFVRSDTYADNNYGADTRLRVDSDANGTTLQTFLRFDLTSVPRPIVTARLRLYVTNGSSTGMEVVAVPNVSWDEKVITWTNQPDLEGAAVGRLGSATGGSFVTVDVTQAVTAGAIVSLGMRAVSTDGVAFASREVPDAPRQPVLLLDLEKDPENSDGGTDGTDGGTGGVVDGGSEDTTAPSVAITEPVSGTTYTTAQMVTLGTEVSDDVGVTRVEFYDGQELRGTDSATPFTFAWNVGPLENGTHTWTARAYDAAGNVSTSAPVTATVNITSAPEGIPTEPNLKVAFIGDTSAGSNYKAVLNLIKSENAEFIVHNGDFDYQNNAAAFFTAMDSVLGAGYPYYFVSKGNHDTGDWSGYAAEFTKRWAKTGAVLDDPNLNDEMWTLTYKGLQMVMVGQNGQNTAFANFINQKLTGDKHIWQICNWHKNQNAMQMGTKGNEMGWAVYENCRKLGAVIATGHEHSYSRTFTLTDMTNQIVDTQCHPEPPATRNRKKVCIGPGRTIAFVSGLGGNSVRNQDRCLPTSYPYGCKNEWASVYASDQSAKYGALFIVFNVDGDPKKANAYFKNVAGDVIDEFTLWKD